MNYTTAAERAYHAWNEALLRHPSVLAKRYAFLTAPRGRVEAAYRAFLTEQARCPELHARWVTWCQRREVPA